MELVSGSWESIGLAAAIFAAGLLIGLLLTRLSSRPHRRARTLERELRALREQEQQYRKTVEEHFGRTSEIFRDLTGEMRTLYTHLADGAERLCDQGVPALRFEPGGLLASSAEATAAGPGAAVDPEGEAGGTGEESASTEGADASRAEGARIG
jgi:uncharacterized membrane-anchored protein YhcB (DUF1043 family)